MAGLFQVLYGKPGGTFRKAEVLKGTDREPIIIPLNGQPMTTLARLRSALSALQPGAPVVLQIQRDQRLLYVAFTLDQL